MKTFNFNNPNKSALVVPKEEGGTKDDTYFGSIGDATMRHVQNLGDEQRQLWEELLHMPSGAIFRIIPSTDMFDSDPLNLNGKNLQMYLKTFEKKGVSKPNLIAIKEAFESESIRRRKSEDVYDKADLIPYSEWEKFPQQWGQIEMPSTPRDRYVYVGNTNQIFYDNFPEGHKDSHLINHVLNLLNRDWDDSVNYTYGEWIKNNIIHKNHKAKGYVKKYLSNLVDDVIANNEKIDEIAQLALDNIDKCWKTEYINNTAKKASKNKMLQAILHNQRNWEEQTKQGINVYSSVKRFGQTLYSNRKQMNAYLWDKYRQLKKLYSPKVMHKGVDINRCRLKELEKTLNLDKQQAKNIWHNRPFDNLSILYHKGYINGNAFKEDKITGKIITLLEDKAKIALKLSNIKKFSDTRHDLMNWQKNKSMSLKSTQWRIIWEYYRLLKNDITKQIKNKK